MTAYDYLREIEQVELRSPVRRSLSELSPLFRELGFCPHDDVVSLDRTGKIPPWQHSSIVEVEVLCDGREVFGFDGGEWEVIRLKYLYATLPYELVGRFIDAAIAVSRKLLLPLEYRGTKIDEATLRQRFFEIRADLLEETGEDAGSEGLAILIHSTYPRR